MDAPVLAAQPIIAISVQKCLQTFSRLTTRFNQSHDLEQNTRFRLWAGNIGALQVGRSSLDYRLREASSTRSLILDIISNLRTTLDRLFDICANPGLIKEVLDGEETTALRHRAAKAIHNLYALSQSIRLSVSSDRYTRSDNVDLSYYKEYDSRHIFEKFPKLQSSLWLAERLVSASNQRRQFLRYRENHNFKLSVPAVKTQRALKPEYRLFRSPEIEESPHLTHNGEQQDLQTRSEAQRSYNASTQAQTDATPYNHQTLLPALSADDDEGRSFTTYATSVGQRNIRRLRPPRMPKAAENGQYFICQYCYFPETVESEHAWRRHVYNDIRPYVCTFEACAAAAFSSQHAWFEHELIAHRKHSICHMCKKSFSEPQLLRSHILEIHQRMISDRQWESLRKLSETPASEFKSSDCPFCTDWDVAHEDDTINSDELFVTTKQFRKHLGRHMEELALFVLPMELGEQTGSDIAEHLSDHNASSESSKIRPLTSVDDSDEISKATSQLLEICDDSTIENIDWRLRVREIIDAGAEMHPPGKHVDPPLVVTVNSKCYYDDKFERVEYLLNHGAEPEYHNAGRSSALQYAVDENIKLLDLMLVKQYWKRGRRHWTEPWNYETTRLLNSHLIYAITKDDAPTALSLLMAGASAQGDEQIRPILFANSARLIRCLEASGADINIRDQDGIPALHHAVLRGDSTLVQAFLAVDADVNVIDSEGDSTLMVSILTGREDIASQLLDPANESVDITIVDKLGRTALMLAAANGAKTIFEKLFSRLGKRQIFEKRQNSGDNALALASAGGHQDIVKQLLHSKWTLSNQNNDGWTPLMHAANQGHSEIVHMLLQAGAPTNLQDKEGSTALAIAADHGRDEIVSALLSASNTFTRVRDNTGRSPFSRAIANNHYAIAQNLLASGADINSIADQGRNPLITATATGHEKALRYLLENDADPDVPDIDGRTALSWASAANNDRVVHLLLSHRANVKLKDVGGRTALSWTAELGSAEMTRLLLDNGSPLTQDKEGRTPLSWAVAQGSMPIVDVFLERTFAFPNMPNTSNSKWLLNHKDNSGRIPLTWAMINGHTTIAQALVEQRCSLVMLDHERYLPLCRAAGNGDLELVTTMLTYGADVNQRDGTECTALSRAAEAGHVLVAKALLLNGANINFKNGSNGRAPLILAVSGGHLDIVKVLIENGADVNVIEETKGQTPLTLAVSSGQKEMVDCLLDKHAYIDQRDGSGRTALSRAAEAGRVTIGKKLIDAGANIDIRDHIYGQAPLILAASGGHQDMVKMLLEHGADAFTRDNAEDGAFVWSARVPANEGLNVFRMLLDQLSRTALSSTQMGKSLIEALSYENDLIVDTMVDLKLLVFIGEKDILEALKIAARRLHLKYVFALLEVLKGVRIHDQFLDLASHSEGQSPSEAACRILTAIDVHNGD